MTLLREICVVGGSLAGLRSVQALRNHGYDGRIALIGEEPHLPYDRPPLSKQVLSGEWGPERVALTDEAELKSLDVDARFGAAAIAADIAERTLTLADGSEMRWDGLVVATGATPRTLRVPTPRQGVLTLRTLDDSLALRGYLDGGAAHVVVVGGGFIGLEVASVCRAAQTTVTVVEALPVTLGRVLGDEVGKRCAKWHADHGVSIRTGASVAAFHGGDRLDAVELSDGTVLPADVAVVGVGVDPSVDWLVGSGLCLDGGLICDSTSMAALGVAGVGDVTRWRHHGYRRLVRIEHWTNATQQAEVATANLLSGADAARDYLPTPYFWSDQLGRRLQFAGVREADDELTVIEGNREPEFIALYHKGDVLHGAFAMGAPRDFLRLRRVVNDGGSVIQARTALAR
jgi:3-phenylpropionate/trans-cinnamate dioxygenase ferredoxin reductase subunit